MDVFLCNKVDYSNKKRESDRQGFKAGKKMNQKPEDKGFLLQVQKIK
jgi:hypothetical protein